MGLTPSAQDERGIELTKLARDPVHLKAFRDHLEDVIHGEFFRGSLRSQQFLQHVIDKSITGDLDSLKERVIGIELFHRSSSYSKEEDAIVRVTASDVRKRLAQHYTDQFDGAEFRIDIPPGSYVPRISWFPPTTLNTGSGLNATPDIDPIGLQRFPARYSLKVLFGTRIAFIVVPLILVLLASSFWAGYIAHKPNTLRPYLSVLPWSVLLSSGRQLQIVASDPDFATLQEFTEHAASLSDYANGRYIPDGTALTPDKRDLYLQHFTGNRAATVDLPAVADIASLCKPLSKKVLIRPAREMRIGDFQSDDDFILLGSPVGNPWGDMFSEQLDFRFVYTDKSTQQSIENVHPRGNEAKLYVPQGRGMAPIPPTGVAYAVITFVQNPRQFGHVLILAGTAPEGTAAASQLAMNVTDLAKALHSCTVAPSQPLRNFELLLRVNIMAGASTNTDVVACHSHP